MDPAATVRLILRAIADRDHGAARRAVADLRAWRDAGGFAPYDWTQVDVATFCRAALATTKE